MTIFPTPTLWADFTGNSAQPYIFGGAAFPNFNTWLAATGGSFTRSSTAFFTNQAGILTQAAVGAIRFDYDPTTLASRGVLLEGTSTNFQTQSQTFSTFSASNCSISTNAGIAPDGTATAAELIESSGLAVHGLFNQIGSNLTTSFTASVFAKASSRTFLAVSGIDDVGNRFAALFNLSNGTVATTNTVGAPTGTSSAIVAFPNGWFRCSVTMNTGNTAAPFMQIGLSDTANPTFSNNLPHYTGDGASFAFIWGAQLENLGFASSYIPTTAGTASRSADSLTTFSVTLPAASIFAEWTPQLLGADPAFTGNGLWQITTNIAGMDVFSVSGELAFRGTGISADIGEAATSGDNRNAAAFQAGSVNIATNGSGTFSSSALTTMPSGSLVIGTARSTLPLWGWMAKFGYWPFLFTLTQLQSITSANTIIQFEALGTNLSRAGRYFSRKDYAKWLTQIVGENEESRREYQRFIDEAKAERTLTYIQRADRDYNVAEEQVAASESALFNNLTETNHIKFSEAKEKRDRARKERDHHYFMEVVNKEWAKYNESKKARH